MSGVEAFVVNRIGSQVERDKAERAQARLKSLGINRQLDSAKTKDPIDDAEIRLSSRQAIAARSRVSIPAFEPQHGVSVQHLTAQRPQALQASTSDSNIRNHSRLPFHGPSPVSPKSLSLFGTDTEGFDDTTGMSDFTYSDLHAGRKTVPSVSISPVDTPNQYAPPQATQEVRSCYATGHAAGARENHDLGAGSDHDGYGEADDQARYDGMMSYEHRRLDRHSPVETTKPASRKRKAHRLAPRQAQREQLSDHLSDAPNRINGSENLATSGPPVLSHHKAQVDEALSISSLEDETDVEGTVPPHSPHSADYSRMIHDSTGELAQLTKGNPIQQASGAYQDPAYAKRNPFADLSPEITSNNSATPGPTIGSSSKADIMQAEVGEPHGFINQRTSEQAKAEVGLDYDIKTLKEMTFQQLADESFDSAPHPAKHENHKISVEDGASLNEKLLYLHSLEGPRDQVQSQRQAFFSSLPIDQYEECGDLMTEAFSQIIVKFKNARQQKRGLAEEFEEEVAARQKLVERRKIAVAEDLDRLKRAGQDVVRGK
ncbi:MAG: hypothetical protein Q9209_000364 [Squamulea sp. 1 TL-2023]